MSRIKRLAVFPTLMKNGWLFRVSVSDHANIMTLGFNTEEPSQFVLQFFDEEADAVEFMNRCVSGDLFDSV